MQKIKLFASDLVFLFQNPKWSAPWNCLWSSALATLSCVGKLEEDSDQTHRMLKGPTSLEEGIKLV